jgi:HK97 family phage prohead protease
MKKNKRAYDSIDFSPPSGVRAEAKKGLAWRKEFNRGGTAVGVARARDLSNGKNISPQTARRMKAYFDRHEVDKKGKGWGPGEEGFPSAGRVAWALWGGEAGYAWARKLVKQMNAQDEGERAVSVASIERRFVAVEQDGVNIPLLRVERRAASEGSDDKTAYIVGYAARFGVDSLDGAVGEFTERIDPGAFAVVSERRGRKNPLMTRALFNHDSNMPLARYPDTLKLSVDEIGLRYEFPVPSTTYGQDLLALIEGGIVRGSSFAFTIARDGEQWSVDENGRHIRTITRVGELFDVGPVTYPAYGDGGLDVAMRSYDVQSRQTKKRTEASEKLLQRAAELKAKYNDLTEWLRANAAR